MPAANIGHFALAANDRLWNLGFGPTNFACGIDVELGEEEGWTERSGLRCDWLAEYTGKRFTFFADPDGLPLEL